MGRKDEQPEKNQAASSLAKQRWAKTTPEERVETARKLAEARWGGKKKKRR